MGELEATAEGWASESEPARALAEKLAREAGVSEGAVAAVRRMGKLRVGLPVTEWLRLLLDVDRATCRGVGAALAKCGGMPARG